MVNEDWIVEVLLVTGFAFGFIVLCRVVDAFSAWLGGLL